MISRIKNNRGYMLIYKPEHPKAISTGYVYEHTLVAERLLGRALNKGEVVHHINQNKSDNTPYNLYVCNNNSEHNGLHCVKNEFKQPLSNLL